MKPSLESLLQDSLSELKDMNGANLPAQPGPVESLDVITHEQVRQEVLDHINGERDSVENEVNNFDADAFIEQNAIDHGRLRQEIGEVRELVGSVVSAMEMLSCVTSMESIDEGAVAMANTALGTIAVQTAQDNIPAFVVEDGKMTTASMESVVDFIVTSLKKMKKWIKEKWDNIVIGWRRGIRTDQVTRLRIEAIQKRIASIGSDYGIPVKQLRYNPEMVGYLYRDGSPIAFEKSALTAALAEAIEYTSWANKNLAADASKRSLAISDNVGKVLMTRDGVEAEKMLREMFKEVSGKNPSEAFLAYGKEVTGGATFLDPHAAAGRPSRDVEWIAELADYIRVPFGHVRFRKSGQFSTKANTLEEISAALEVAIEAIESEAYNDYNWYNEISGAWNSAYQMYDRMINTVNGVYLPHMNNELWRALDVACSAMFVMVERAYYQTIYMRSPSFRLIQGLVYVCEEQMKAYAAVNR